MPIHLSPSLLATGLKSTSRLSRTRRDITLLTRDDDHDGGLRSPGTATIVVGGIILGGILVISSYILLRLLRRRYPDPKYIPTPVLKRLWSGWKGPAARSGPRYQLPLDDDAEALTGRGHPARELNPTSAGTSRPPRAGTGGHRSSTPAVSTSTTAEGGVDRNASVRSVLTLPAYRIQPTDSEQVLGREGDRDGVDVVVELPTAEEDEAMRDEEMNALYQIRLARRRQVAEREDRRQRRREARERHDRLAIEGLRDEVRAASYSNAQETGELRGQHDRIKQARQRAVSSVSYHDVGVARHDGTRIRANSSESERVGLLSDAASIALSTRSAGVAGPSQGPGSLFHRRDRSASSVLSVDTAQSNERPSSPAMVTGGSNYSLHSHNARSRANSGPNTPRMSGTSTRAGSVAPGPHDDTGEADLGEAEMPLHSPPGYDDVSLNDDDEAVIITPVHSRGGSRSGANSLYNEPPPEYPGPLQARKNRLSAHMTERATEAAAAGEEGEGRGGHSRQSSRGVGGSPQLPSLRLAQLPQIVIDRSNAGQEGEERR